MTPVSKHVWHELPTYVTPDSQALVQLNTDNADQWVTKEIRNEIISTYLKVHIREI